MPRIAPPHGRLHPGSNLRAGHSISHRPYLLQAADHVRFRLLYGSNLGAHDEDLCRGSSRPEGPDLNQASDIRVAHRLWLMRTEESHQSPDVSREVTHAVCDKSGSG